MLAGVIGFAFSFWPLASVAWNKLMRCDWRCSSMIPISRNHRLNIFCPKCSEYPSWQAALLKKVINASPLLKEQHEQAVMLLLFLWLIWPIFIVVIQSHPELPRRHQHDPSLLQSCQGCPSAGLSALWHERPSHASALKRVVVGVVVKSERQEAIELNESDEVYVENVSKIW